MQNEPITVKEFTRLYAELCAAYDKPINEITAMIYFKFVKDYSADHVASAVYGWISREDFFPRINRLLIELKELGRFQPYNHRQIGDGDFVPAGDVVKNLISQAKEAISGEK